MPENISNTIISFLFLGVGAVAFVGILVKAMKNRWAPTKTVQAVVIDKHTIETFSKYSGTGKHEKYAVVFSAGGKKKTFYVSQFSYGGYRVGEKGTLTYKGDKLIAFE